MIVSLAAIAIVGAVIAIGAVGERRRQAEFGRLSRRHLAKYR